MMAEELWNPPEDASEFELPGDEQVLARLEDATPTAEPEPTPQVETDERARDEKGRFAKAEEQEAAAEPVESSEVPPAEPAVRQKSTDDYERELGDRQAFIERQANELGQLRQYMQQLTEQQQRQAQAPTDWQSLIDENPAQAAQLAYQHQNPTAYRAAMEAWEDVSPGTPAVWTQNVALWQEQQRQSAYVQQQQWLESVNRFSAENPGFAEFSTDELIAAGERNPALLELIQKSDADPNARMGALRVLHVEAERARGRTAGTLVDAAKDLARVQAAETQRAKEEAILASAGASLDGGPKPSVADRIAEQWDEIEKPYTDGWNI